MNIQKLLAAEARFLESYPQGFNSPEMEEIRKKHKMPQLFDFVTDNFAKEAFRQPSVITENFTKLIGRSTMISLFEKPKFRDFARSLGSQEQEILSAALYERLHGKKKEGFEMLVDLLAPAKLAKWSIVSALPLYFAPKREVFVKPTTAKMIVAELELDLVYKPAPTWSFYTGFRADIQKMKKEVSPLLAPNNAAFTGFLMMSLGDM